MCEAEHVDLETMTFGEIRKYIYTLEELCHGRDRLLDVLPQGFKMIDKDKDEQEEFIEDTERFCKHKAHLKLIEDAFKNMPQIRNWMRLEAAIMMARFEALKAEGFTPAQALEIVVMMRWDLPGVEE